MLIIVYSSPLAAQEVQENLAVGVWVPAIGDVGQRSVTKITIGGDGALYALGSGKVWVRPSKRITNPTISEEKWRDLGRFSPLVAWDEGEGFSVSGPFSSQLLSEIERQLSVAMEGVLDTQGDEDYISEDAVFSLIEAYEEETQPALDSPYRVNDCFLQREGVWLATGAGIWATTPKGLLPLLRSPAPALSISQLGQELWVSTTEGVYRTSNYLSEVSDAILDGRQPSFNWLKRSTDQVVKLLRLGGELLAWSGQTLSLIREEEASTEVITPLGTKTLAVSRVEKDERIWALTSEGVWVSSASLPLAWRRCITLSRPLAQLHDTSIGLIVVTPQRITRISHDCKRIYDYEQPLSESVQFYDVEWWEGALYVATSGGVFKWEDIDSDTQSKVGVRYLQRDLKLFPRFFEIYQAALREQGLDQRNVYGMRPVLSAALPQLRLRYTTLPSRVDEVPTFNGAGRQLTLMQPVPEFQIFVEWRISLDFLTTLIDPERTSAFAEAKSQLDLLVDDPSQGITLESEVGLMEDWTEEVFTSQAQRLALTTVAVERRQMHRDREQLRTRLIRLHRERVKLTYKRWLEEIDETSMSSRLLNLRLKELDAHLDAATGYRLQIQKTMKSD